MLRFNLKSTEDYDEIIKFLYDNGLNFDGDISFISPHFIKAFKVTQGDDFLIGGAILGYREGKYILDGIAVDKVLRKLGIGKILVNKIISEVKSRGGNSLYLISKVPEFYYKLGFTKIDDFKEVPKAFRCEACDKFGKDCPEVLLKKEF